MLNVRIVLVAAVFAVVVAGVGMLVVKRAIVAEDSLHIETTPSSITVNVK